MQIFNVKSLLNRVKYSLLNRVKKSLLNGVKKSLLNGVNTQKQQNRLQQSIWIPKNRANCYHVIFMSLCYFTNTILLVPRSCSALKESQQGETLHCLLFLILRRCKALKGQRWVYVPKTGESGW